MSNCPGPLLLTRINFNYIMHKQFHRTLYRACDVIKFIKKCKTSGWPLYVIFLIWANPTEHSMTTCETCCVIHLESVQRQAHVIVWSWYQSDGFFAWMRRMVTQNEALVFCTISLIKLLVFCLFKDHMLLHISGCWLEMISCEKLFKVC